MPSFSRELEKTLHRSLDIAKEFKHEYATLEHLLLSLLFDKEALKSLCATCNDIALLKKQLLEYIDTELGNLKVDRSIDAKPTAGFQRVVQRAVAQIKPKEEKEVTGQNLIVAIFSEKNSHAAYFLQDQGATRKSCADFMMNGTARVQKWMSRYSEFIETLDQDPPYKKSGSESISEQRKTKKGASDKELAMKSIKKCIRTKAPIAGDLVNAMLRLAQLELRELESRRPNSPEAIEQNDAQIELLKIFAAGFSSIAKSLSSMQPEKENSVDDAVASVVSLSEALNNWWQGNNQKLVNVTVGLPFVAGAATTMNILGADPYCQVIATGATASVWFGKGVLQGIAGATKSLAKNA